MEQIELASIVIPEGRLRPAAPDDDEELQRLAASMARGQLQPILVTADHVLIAGLQRCRAAQLLGWQTIGAEVFDGDDIDRQLAEIDENVCRSELTPLQMGEQLLLREDLLAARGVRAQSGASVAMRLRRGDLESPESIETTASIAAKAGLGERVAQQRKQIARDLSASVKEAIRGTPLESRASDLLALARLPADEQMAAVQLVLSGEADSLRDAIRRLRPQDEPPGQPDAGAAAEPGGAGAIEIPAARAAEGGESAGAVTAREPRFREPFQRSGQEEDADALLLEHGLEVTMADDCLAAIGRLADSSIATIITAIRANRGATHEGDLTLDQQPWPEYYAWLGRLLDECYRVLVPGGAIAISVPLVVRWRAGLRHGNTWSDYDPQAPGAGGSRGKGAIEYLGLRLIQMMQGHDGHMGAPILWLKRNPAQKAGAAAGAAEDELYEIIVTGYKGQWPKDGSGQPAQAATAADTPDAAEVWFAAPPDSAVYRAGFPSEIAARLLRRLPCPDPNGIVLDPWAGIGATGIACLQAAPPRRFIGFDPSARYIGVARGLLLEAIRNPAGRAEPGQTPLPETEPVAAAGAGKPVRAKPQGQTKRPAAKKTQSGRAGSRQKQKPAASAKARKPAKAKTKPKAKR